VQGAVGPQAGVLFLRSLAEQRGDELGRVPGSVRLRAAPQLGGAQFPSGVRSADVKVAVFLAQVERVPCGRPCRLRGLFCCFG
jgi:hypothetical protein